MGVCVCVCVCVAGIIGCRLVTGALCLSVGGPSRCLLRVPLPAVTACTAVPNTTAFGKLWLRCWAQTPVSQTRGFMFSLIVRSFSVVSLQRLCIVSKCLHISFSLSPGNPVSDTYLRLSLFLIPYLGRQHLQVRGSCRACKGYKRVEMV